MKNTDYNIPGSRSDYTPMWIYNCKYALFNSCKDQTLYLKRDWTSFWLKLQSTVNSISKLRDIAYQHLVIHPGATMRFPVVVSSKSSCFASFYDCIVELLKEPAWMLYRIPHAEECGRGNDILSDEEIDRWTTGLISVGLLPKKSVVKGLDNQRYLLLNLSKVSESQAYIYLSNVRWLMECRALIKATFHIMDTYKVKDLTIAHCIALERAPIHDGHSWYNDQHYTIKEMEFKFRGTMLRKGIENAYMNAIQVTKHCLSKSQKTIYEKCCKEWKAGEEAPYISLKARNKINEERLSPANRKRMEMKTLPSKIKTLIATEEVNL